VLPSRRASRFLAAGAVAALALTSATVRADEDDDPTAPPMRRNSVPVMVTGIGVTAVGGAAALGGLLLAFSEQDSFSAQERNAVGLALLGVTLVGAGVPLLVTGGRRVPVIDPNRVPTSRVLIYREPIPDGYHVEHRPSRGLILAGSLVFLASYGLSFRLAAGDPSGKAAYVPLAGPFIASIASDARDGDEDGTISDEEERRRQAGSMVFAWTGLAQHAGVALQVAGIHGGAVLVRHAPPRPQASSAATPEPPTLHLGLGSATVRWRF
jgi:hypothetical protein